jgi:DNA-binding NarL/FixJ family response regulator
MYKIAIIETQSVIREGLNTLLSKQTEFDVISIHADLIGFFQEVGTLKLDVIFIGLNTIESNEFKAIEKIRCQFINAKILVFSTNHQEECIRYAFRAGVHGYLHRDTTADQLHSAVKAVLEGHIYLSQTILATVLNCFVYSANRSHPNSETVLTDREKELLSLISNGYKNREIADKLRLSVKTIESHRCNLMKKLQVHNVINLTTKAIQLGILNSAHVKRR